MTTTWSNPKTKDRVTTAKDRVTTYSVKVAFRVSCSSVAMVMRDAVVMMLVVVVVVDGVVVVVVVVDEKVSGLAEKE